MKHWISLANLHLIFIIAVVLQVITQRGMPKRRVNEMSKKLLEIAAEIVQTQVSMTSMTAVEISSSLRTVYQTLQEIQKSEAAGTILAPQMMVEETRPEEAPNPVDPKDSIKEDKVICLECGAEMRQLTTKHLVSHGMDQKQYKKKYGFSMKTPLSAKSLTKARSKAAKKRGLPEKLKAFIEARRQQKTGAAVPVAITVEASKPKRTRIRKKKAV